MQEGDASTNLGDADAEARTERAPARLTIALAWVGARRGRDRAFQIPGFFADPAWDILLDLFISHVRGAQSTVGDVCLASTVSASTVLRWILVLEREGIVERRPDSNDRRRILVSLSAKGLTRMEQALDASAESDAKLGLGRLRLVK
jgi:DNA-binding transcriptional ArsR family regulator